MQEQRGELTSEEARAIQNFLLLGRWRSLIDLAVVMSVAPEQALERENNARISKKGGSIMNTEVLTALCTAVDAAVRSFGPNFKKVLPYVTSGQTIRESNAALASKLLENLDSFLDPEILVVPREKLESLQWT